MSSADGRCSSCGVVLKSIGVASFDCPSCGAVRIGRCTRCRDQSVPYTCTACGFKGP